MSLLAALTIKVSAILLLVLAGAVCLRTRSASARHWVLAVGIVAAGGAPALHVLPILPVVEVAPTAAGVLGPAVASEAVAGRRERRCRRPVGRNHLAGGHGGQRRCAPGRVGETPMAPRVVASCDGRTVASAVLRSRTVLRPEARCRPAVRAAARTGGHVGLAAGRRDAAGVRS